MTYPTHFLYCNNDICDTILKLELYQFLIFINFGKCSLLRKACGIMRYYIKFPCPKYFFLMQYVAYILKMLISDTGKNNNYNYHSSKCSSQQQCTKYINFKFTLHLHRFTINSLPHSILEVYI